MGYPLPGRSATGSRCTRAPSTSPALRILVRFGSDVKEFGILGAIGAGIYQLIKKCNCHEPGCWRIGQHPAAGGQFLLCYRHHPDYEGKRPTRELIHRLHREHLEREAAIHGKLDENHQHLQAKPPAAYRVNGPDTTATTAHTAGDHQG